MCGIVGGISFDGRLFPNKEEINQSMRMLRHRGPDFSDSAIREGANSITHFAHTRLSIIDLSTAGNQPMADTINDTLIVCNGEIYNYKSIKTDLISLGYTFNTNSDTEVILKAYDCWGIEKMLEKLDGMFAFALFDKKNEELYLARDRFGKKPLCFWQNGTKLAFSSDTRSFEYIKELKLNVSTQSLGYYFAELSSPESSTIWEGVNKVQPGHFLKFTKKGIERYEPFWSLNYTYDCRLRKEEIIEHVDELLSSSVKKRMVADVHVAALLSGGIDSSLVVAKMAEQSSKRIKTYSVGFKDEKFNELPYARQVANKFDTDHTEFILHPSNLSEINSIIHEYGEPFADSSMIPTYLISKEISKTEKVVLGGDGGDELFSGYHSYYFAYKYDKVKKFKHFKSISKVLRQIYPTYRTDFLHRLLCQTENEPYTLLNRNFGFDSTGLANLYNNAEFYNCLEKEHQMVWKRFKQSEDLDLINVLSSSLHTRLVNDYLVKVDKASMFASLEMRSPFLDKDLASFASTLTPAQLYGSSGSKSILKDIASSYFSDTFVNRQKMGFGVPIGQWFKKELNSILREVVIGGRQDLIPLNYDFIETIIKEHESGEEDHVHKIWALYVFHVWAQAR